MAPSTSLWKRTFDLSVTGSDISAQLTNPGDIFSILLILGGEVVCQAIAQLAGRPVAPVAFSFGWVAYIVSALLTAIGEHRVMPLADSKCLVINAKSGYARENISWVLGRVMRDYEHWMDGGRPDGPIRCHLNQMLDQRWEKSRQDAEKAQPGSSVTVPRPSRAGLCVAVYHAEHARVGNPGYDLLYFLGVSTAVIQMGIAAIPLGLYGDWSVLFVTVVGIVLSVVTASLPQWTKEKWKSRHNSTKTVILTRGNGSQHAIIIVGTGKGLDLEDLAAGPVDVDTSGSTTTILSLAGLAVLWTMLLIIAGGFQNNTWYQMAVGGIGICENIFVAGWPRNPEDFGVPLTFKEVIGEPKVMATLFAVEKAYPRAGRAMLETFFPGKLTPQEEEQWDELGKLADALDEARRKKKAAS